MSTYSGIDASQAVVSFVMNHGTKLPEDQRDFLAKSVAGPDILRLVIVCMEVLYASRSTKDLPKEAFNLMHDLAEFVMRNNFYEMGGIEGRALQIMNAAQRILEGGPLEDENDPKVSSEYSAPRKAQEPVS